MIFETVQKALKHALKDPGIARREVPGGIMYWLGRVREGLERETELWVSVVQKGE